MGKKLIKKKERKGNTNQHTEQGRGAAEDKSSK